MDSIDWNVAQRVGEMLSGGSPYVSPGTNAVQSLAEDFATRVSAYTGLKPSGGIPEIESIDRPRWIEANIATMQPLLDPMTKRLGGGSGPLGPALRSTTQLLLGAQVGALTGVLSQRVLGQYDISLLDAEREPRLLLLAPNIAQAARNLSLDRDEFTNWVAIHEVTHAVQFGGAPWLRDHLGGMLRELLEGMQVGVRLRALPSLPSAADLRSLVDRLRAGDLLRIGLGEERWALVEEMQATMSLIEGHAEHVMDAVGAEVLPSLEKMRTAMNKRRRSRAWPWRILERLMGLEMKMRQYEVGRAFCDEVVEAGGPGALARAWESSSMLPSMQELQQPAAWLQRTHVPSVTS
ncbi:MAG: zinc-dependent metalloprotease [Solirubrobacteraceae bacterium]